MSPLESPPEMLAGLVGSWPGWWSGEAGEDGEECEARQRDPSQWEQHCHSTAPVYLHLLSTLLLYTPPPGYSLPNFINLNYYFY